MYYDNDLCMTCGAEAERKLWGAKCNCGDGSVHQHKCDGCGRICGLTIDDDYCGPDKLFCPDCVDKAKSLKEKI